MNIPGRICFTFSSLPEDILLEISTFLEAEDVFALCMASKRLQAFTTSRHLWHKLALKLSNRIPLAIPPLRARSSISTQEFQKYAQHALRLENNWRSKCPAPIKPPRYLSLSSNKAKGVMMLRLLPGGRIFLLITTDGQLTCRDLRDGRVIGEWKHGGSKVHSIDVDVVDDGKGMILTVSVDSEKFVPSSDMIVEIHTVHVLRLDVTENQGQLVVDFVHIMASPWDNPWWIVSVEGDIVAAYSCDMDGRPLAQFVVWIANWRTITAAVVHLPDSVIHLETWPTLQVVGGQVIIHEERGCVPASIIFPVPDTLFSTESTDPLPHVKITPTLIMAGDHEDNAYQTRFSKLWRNACPRTAASRPISLFSISQSLDPARKRTITVQTFDPFPRPAEPPNSTKAVMHKSKVWTRSAFVPQSQDGLRFTFCLGRYGSFPVWLEEEDPPAEIPDITTYIPSLRLMGLFTDYKNGGVSEAKYMACPEGVPLEELQCMDFDDAEGILCGITELGVWIIEY